ncbi:MAG TPA: T9SS type A sorting domain-containing protein [Bacteroidia bacterium]|nr:T9SS type A sorting domain-containing protein [Bacteroidia bacterium]
MKRCVLYFSFFIFHFSFSHAQIINTIVGNGIAGYSGDGGQATDAEIWGPSGVFVDKIGTIYIADALNNRIRKVDTAGIITTVAGNGYGSGGNGGYSGDGGVATDAELYFPISAILDNKGNIYIGDDRNCRVRMVNTAGIISTFAGDGILGFSGDGGIATAAEIKEPGILGIDTFQNIYIADALSYRVRKVNTSGIITTVAGGGGNYPDNGGPATAAQLGEMYGLLVSNTNNYYFSVEYQSRVCEVNSSGILNTLVGNGVSGFSGDGGLATDAELNIPGGVYFDANNNLIFSDASNYRIRLVNLFGVISTIVGNGVAGFSGDGGPATDAEVNIVEDLYEDGQNNLYLADYYNNRLRKVTGLNISTGISNVNNNLFTVYPNPSSGFLYINTSEIQIKNGIIRIIDMFGNEALEINISDNQQKTPIEINISALSKGEYFIDVSGNNYKYTQKFIKI